MSTAELYCFHGAWTANPVLILNWSNKQVGGLALSVTKCGWYKIGAWSAVEDAKAVSDRTWE